MSANVRSRSRSWALQLLYAWELTDRESTPTAYADRALERRRMSRRYRPHALDLVRVVEDHLTEIDGLITEHAANWRMERIGAIDRNVLRIGIAELRWFEDIPPKVAIHEAMRLATRYGGPDSTRFVNGVLDAVHKKEDAAAK